MIMMTHLTDVINMWALESSSTVKDRIRRNMSLLAVLHFTALLNTRGFLPNSLYMTRIHLLFYLKDCIFPHENI